MASRGLSPEVIERYRLGIVDGSHDEHEDFTGRIAIPYLTPLAGPVSFKFRVSHICDDGCNHAKYLSPYESRLYNTIAMDEADKRGYIAAVEGELNALVLTHFCDIPAVGIPGAKMWAAHPEWRELFKGYERVLLFPDVDHNEDEAGKKLSKLMLKDLDTAQIIRLPDEMDPNEAYLAYGPAKIRELAGL